MKYEICEPVLANKSKPLKSISVNDAKQKPTKTLIPNEVRSRLIQVYWRKANLLMDGIAKKFGL
jgi:hypothetical protein